MYGAGPTFVSVEGHGKKVRRLGSLWEAWEGCLLRLAKALVVPSCILRASQGFSQAMPVLV